MAPLKDKRLRQKVIDICRQMNTLGLNLGTSGNVSVRNKGGFLITPSGIPYDSMTPDQIVQMDLDAGYRGEWLPSSEWRMHLDIFAEHKQANAVVHVHSTYATALSCLRLDVPAFHYMIGVTGGTTLRCADYATFGTRELSEAMGRALEDRTACLLANHGQICFGPDLDKTLWLAGEIEALCHQYHVARLTGEPVILDDKEMDRVLKRFKTYGKQMGELKDLSETAVEAPIRRDA